MSRKIVRVTTEDNPWDPFANEDEWYRYDMQHGYRTCERLSRQALTSDVFPINVNLEIIEEAIDQMCKEGAFDNQGNFVNYKKVYKEVD